MSDLQPHQQRVVDEKTELDEKLNKLHSFIQESPIFATLSDAEQHRLRRQDLIMAEYSQILSERIAAFNELETTSIVPVHVVQTKTHRKDLDDVLQRIKRDSDKHFTGIRAPEHPVRASRERSLAITKIEEGIMWLGMDLKAQGTENPYPNSYNAQSPVIEPTADNLKL